MRANKLNLDSSSVGLLRSLKARTGLTHQYLCRVAFVVSLAEPTQLDPADYDEKGLEFNRYTLTGELDLLFVAYLREWLALQERAPDHSEAAWFRAHINRGLSLLPRRVKNLADVGLLAA